MNGSIEKTCGKLKNERRIKQWDFVQNVEIS